MDSYVRTLLESWNLEKYVDVFAENEVSRINFHLLTKDAITELIPKIGPRALFLREFQKLQAERSIEVSSALENSIYNSYDLNFTSEMKDSIERLDIVPYDYNNRFKVERKLNGTMSETHDKEDFKKTDVFLLTESSIVEPHSSTDDNTESSSLNLTVDSKTKSLADSSEDNLKQENAAEISDQNSWDFNIKQILSKSNSGKEVLQRLNTQNLTTDYRYKFTRILVEELVKRFGPYPSREVKENLAEAVIKYFPFLKDEDGGYSSWFTRGKNHKQSTGYLEERLRNHRRKYCRERSPETFADEICLPANAKKRRRKIKNSCSDDESIWNDENDDNNNDDDKSENQLQSEKICRSDKNKNSNKLDKKVLKDCDKDSDNEELDELMVVSYHDYCSLKNEFEKLKTKLEEEKQLRQNLEKQIQNSVGVIKKEGIY